MKIRPNKTIFKRFYQLFFKTTGLQHNLLILIESPNIFHWKSAKRSKVGLVFGAKFGPNLFQCCEESSKTGMPMGFFYVLHEVCKQQVAFIEIYVSGKLNAKLARNNIFDRGN